jgi:hypothetical protein
MSSNRLKINDDKYNVNKFLTPSEASICTSRPLPHPKSTKDCFFVSPFFFLSSSHSSYQNMLHTIILFVQSSVFSNYLVYLVHHGYESK